MQKNTILLCFSFICSSLIGTPNSSLPDYTTLETQTSYPILNPTLAERKTAKIILKNGVQAYLVSDPNIDQSAAAVCMEAGSWNDPDEYPGTAHFLEHMLFMGTEAYPDESEYMKYIKDNGGAVNAFTASDRTVYMFSINNDALTGAFDRFSHFFLDPLFNPSCINRELHAVDQEFSKNIENDSWRTFMVLKETSRKDHPNTKFSTGNAKTLSGIPQEALKKWYKTYYRADKMHVTMLSSLSLEEMSQLIYEKFNSLPSTDVQSTLPYESVLSDNQKGHFLFIKPIKDLKVLSLIFELPREFSSIDQKWTANLVSYVFNDASDQSLLHELKKQKLAESISSFTDNLSKEDRLFCIDISLTELGLFQMDTVISLCYQTLARLKQTGIPLSLFQEVDTMAKIRYQYQSKEDPFTWITDIAASLPDENLATFPEKTYIPGSFDPEALSQLLDSLTPESCIYLVLADPDKLGITLQNTEKWMKVPYTLEEITPTKLLAWKKQAPNPSIQIPPLNPFLPDSLALLTSTETKNSPFITPIQLANNKKSSFYFAQDTQYLLPESTYIFNIKTKALDGSAKAKVLADLLCKTLYDQLSSTIFFADHAGLSCKLFPNKFNFSIHVSGYSEKASKLTEKIFESLKEVSCSKEDFSLYKDSLASSYANESAVIPLKQA
ncbi:MAG: insulinase family protein, partial [Verrucomicrobia bacterium]|nr:insulinase family protein [Verrucomicrobiota bacterium]